MKYMKISMNQNLQWWNLEPMFKKVFTSINLSIVASVGRYVIKNRMFLYSISAGSGLRTFIAELPVDDIIPDCSLADDENEQ